MKKLCIICSNVLPPRHSSFCSKECMKINATNRNALFAKTPNGRKCKRCTNDLTGTQEAFCGENCQHSYYSEHAVRTKRISKNCIICGSSFEFVESWKSQAKRKYCSRKCKDLHQKELYSGPNNPCIKHPVSDETRKKHSKSSIDMWKRTDFREKFFAGRQLFIDTHDHVPGWDEKSVVKRRQTLLQRYGAEHNWQVPEIREKCEETCLQRYGMYSWQISKEKIQYTDTTIEKIVASILDKNNIAYKKQYRLYYEKHRFSSYDFYLENTKILIEADGDFWHANPSIYNDLSLLYESQVRNIKNDFFKSELAIITGYRLYRFWESDILQCDFEQQFLREIKWEEKF